MKNFFRRAVSEHHFQCLNLSLHKTVTRNYTTSILCQNLKKSTFQKIMNLEPALHPEKLADILNNSSPEAETTVKKTKQKSSEGVISYQDMITEMGFTPLQVIYHKPLYPLPIPTNPDYKHLTIHERTQLLCDYHTSISSLRAKLAQKSKHMAPLPKPILPSAKCTTSMIKNDEENTQGDFNADAFEETNNSELYVSRSGRQTKRKLYTENLGTDSDDSQFALLKRNKFDNDDAKITFDTPFLAEFNNGKSFERENDSESQDSPKNQKKFSVSVKKTWEARKTLGPLKRLPKSELLFEKLQQEDAKKKKEEEEQAAFEQSLLIEDDNSLDMFVEADVHVVQDSQSPEKEPEESGFVRRRVIPPPPAIKGRRPLKKRLIIQKEEDLDGIDFVPESPPKRQGAKNTSVRPTRSRENQPSTSKNARDDNELVKCPLCQNMFLQNIIQEHASTCGEMPEDNHVPAPETHTCNICDETFSSRAVYKQHHQQCLASMVETI